MKTIFVVPAVLLTLCFTSCRKQELPVPATSTASQASLRIGPPHTDIKTVAAVKIPCTDR